MSDQLEQPPEGCTCPHWWIDPTTRQEYPQPSAGGTYGPLEIRYSLDEDCPVHGLLALRAVVHSRARRRTNDYVVRIVQKRAPSEISYLVPEQDVQDFISRWHVENPDQLIHASSMPLVAWSPSAPIPVAYDTQDGGTVSVWPEARCVCGHESSDHTQGGGVCTASDLDDITVPCACSSFLARS